MKHYIAVIHKEPDSAFGVSFPDVPGVIASAASRDAALAEALAFAAEDWASLAGAPFPQPRTLDALHEDSLFRQRMIDAVVAAIPLDVSLGRAA